ncbi:hypothetical protein [Streptomyces sp. NPDC006477]|uniref:hypothetical protein n=1 Tax=Streptomyces sp. NPDC006477 TaxID=3364747 RepID=UPI0036B8F1BF
MITGVDPSSRKLAVVTTFGDWAEPEMLTFDLPENHIEGCGLAFRRFFEYLSGVKERTGHTPFVFQERPLMSNMNPHSTIVQALVGGAAIAAAEECMCQADLVNVQTWKKLVVGKGNASKPEVSEWVHENWPVAYDLAGGDQDLLDAAAINRHGNMVLNAPKRRIVIRRPKLKVVA